MEARTAARSRAAAEARQGLGGEARDGGVAPRTIEEFDRRRRVAQIVSKQHRKRQRAMRPAMSQANRIEPHPSRAE